MQLINVALGTVFEIQNEERIIAQVGAGGDCGVFISTLPVEDVLQSSPIFRVCIIEKELKKSWKRLGVFPLSPYVDYFQTYHEKESFPERWFTLTLQDVDNRKEVTRKEAEEYEWLAMYTTEHIMNRVHGRDYF